MRKSGIESLYYVFLEGKADLMIVRDGIVQRATNRLRGAVGRAFSEVEGDLLAAGAKVDWVRDVEILLTLACD